MPRRLPGLDLIRCAQSRRAGQCPVHAGKRRTVQLHALSDAFARGEIAAAHRQAQGENARAQGTAEAIDVAAEQIGGHQALAHDLVTQDAKGAFQAFADRGLADAVAFGDAFLRQAEEEVQGDDVALLIAQVGDAAVEQIALLRVEGVEHRFGFFAGPGVLVAPAHIF